jgi:hypothetical protein
MTSLVYRRYRHCQVVQAQIPQPVQYQAPVEQSPVHDVEEKYD